MTPKQADALIKTGAPVTLRTAAGETFTAVIVRRDRWNVHTAAGAVLDRGELEIVTTKRPAPDKAADPLYVIRNSAGNYYEGRKDDGAPVWTTNLQSAAVFIGLESALIYRVNARADRYFTGDPAAEILDATIDNAGYTRIATPAADAAEEMADKIERIGQFIADNAAAIVARTGAGHYNALAVIENLASWIAAETAPAEFWHGDTDKAAAQVTPIAAALVAIIGADAAAKAWRLAGQE